MSPTMDLELFVTPGLGDTSYLIASGGEAALVDPQRDAWRFLDAAAAHGWRVVRVLETHVHNDYLSGALETAAATGAEIVAPARGGYEFAHRPADEGDVVEVGGLRLTAMATPGHTPEHLSWLVGDADASGDDAAPVAAFTGGSLLVGSAGRTDLLGPTLLPALTADQFRSLRRLAALPDTTRVLPTHGSGSFCSAGPAASSRTSTIGQERLTNAAFGAEGEGEFRSLALGSLGRYPAYYRHMAGLNRRGPRVLGGPPTVLGLDAADFAATAGRGTPVIDARSRRAFADTHIPGSLNIELNESFASYVGWLVPFGSPILLVLPEPVVDARREALDQLLRIGYERVLGWLEGGLEAWAAAGRPTSSYDTLTIADLGREVAEAEGGAAVGAEPYLLDVRQPMEWRDDGVIPDAERIFVADLPDRLADLPRDRPISVFCKSGARAAIAASLLDGAGFDVRLVGRGGAPTWPGELERLAPADPVGG